MVFTFYNVTDFLTIKKMKFRGSSSAVKEIMFFRIGKAHLTFMETESLDWEQTCKSWLAAFQFGTFSNFPLWLLRT